MIKLSYNIKNYRKDILALAKNNSTIIELGCHTGGTTRLLPDSSKIIAVDNSPEAVSEMKKLSHVNFISGDVRLYDIMQEAFKITQKCDILAIDLGGGYHPDTVFKVFYIWSSTFKPTHTIIRNRGILEFVNSAKTSGEEHISEDGYLKSYHDSGIPPQIKEFRLWSETQKK